VRDGGGGKGTGYGALAYAAFGRGDGDNVGDAFDGAFLGEAALEAGNATLLGEALLRKALEDVSGGEVVRW
jgi:hypothetical protein